MSYIGDVAQLIIALTVVFNCWQSWRNGRKAEQIKAGVSEIKAQTNGLTEALVSSASKAAMVEGAAAGFAAGSAMGLEQGRKEGA
jgi:hypothetical protein